MPGGAPGLQTPGPPCRPPLADVKARNQIFKNNRTLEHEVKDQTTETLAGDSFIKRSTALPPKCVGSVLLGWGPFSPRSLLILRRRHGRPTRPLDRRLFPRTAEKWPRLQSLVEQKNKETLNPGFHLILHPQSAGIPVRVRGNPLPEGKGHLRLATWTASRDHQQGQALKLHVYGPIPAAFPHRVGGTRRRKGHAHPVPPGGGLPW